MREVTTKSSAEIRGEIYQSNNGEIDQKLDELKKRMMREVLEGIVAFAMSAGNFFSIIPNAGLLITGKVVQKITPEKAKKVLSIYQKHEYIYSTVLICTPIALAGYTFLL